MQITTITVGAFDVNCYLLQGAEPEVLVVDPGDEAGRIRQEITARGLSVAAYLLTHGHPDHISALHELFKLQPAPVYLHASDAAWAFNDANRILPFYDVPGKPECGFQEIRDGSSWREAGLDFMVFETPGHTPGGVCYYFSDARVLITGDTLFAGSAGRTDLPGGDANMLGHSLRRLASFTDNVVIYPGHGPSSSIGQEKQSNPFLRIAPS